MRQFNGLTLFGFILTLMVVGVLAYIFIPKYFAPSVEQSKTKLRADLSQLNDALENYRLDNGTYPTTEQGLVALVIEPASAPAPQFWKKGGYITKLPRDPWGHDYQYVNNYDVIRVYSFGPGGENGGTEQDVSTIDNNK